LTKGNTTVPQVFTNSTHIGGLREILELLQNGKLQEALTSPLVLTQPINFDIPPVTPRPQRVHVKLNPVIETLWMDLRQGNFMGGKRDTKRKTQFKSSDFIHFLVKQHSKDKADAVTLGIKFQEMGYICRCKDPDKPFADDSSSWQFTIDMYEHILNAKLTNPQKLKGTTGEQADRSCSTVSRNLFDALVAILGDHVDQSGAIDYGGILSSEEWGLFTTDLLELNSIRPVHDDVDGEYLVFFSQIFYILYHHVLIINRGNIEPKKMASYGYLINGNVCKFDTICFVLRTGKLPSFGADRSSHPSPDSKKSPKDKKPKKDKGAHNDFPPPGAVLDELHSLLSAGYINPDLRTLFLSMNLSLCSVPILAFNVENLDYAMQWNAEALCQSVLVNLSTSTVILPYLFAELFRDVLVNKEVFLRWLVGCLQPREEEKLGILLNDVNRVTIVFRRAAWEQETTLNIMSLIEPPITVAKIAGPPSNQEQDSVPLPIYTPIAHQDQTKSLEVDTIVHRAVTSKSPKIVLREFGLTHLPTSLHTTPNPSLKRLELHDNCLTVFPPSFEISLSGLTYLFLTHNQLKCIPIQIALLSALECLDLSHNEIASIPNAFFRLRDLKQLNLNFNKLTTLPYAFPQLRALEEVGLAHNLLSSIPHNFGQMRRIETLDLSNNQLSIIPSLHNLNSLTELYLHKNKIEDISNIGLVGIRHLFIFNLAYNSISNIPLNISRLVYLKEFNIAHNQLTTVPSHICELLSVQKISFSGNPITTPDEKVYKSGIKEIRNHFKWEKPLGVPPYILDSYQNPPTPRDKKQQVERSLSVKEKQALFLKKKRTHYIFEDSASEQTRKSTGFDISSIVAADTIKNDEKEALMSISRDGDGSKDGLTNYKIDLSTVKIVETEHHTSGACILIKHGVSNYFVERPQAGDDDSIKLKHFGFKPIYLKRLSEKTHVHFLGISKERGPVVLSIEIPYEEESPSSARGGNSSRGRSKSLAVMNQRLRQKHSKSKVEQPISLPPLTSSGSSGRDRQTKGRSTSSCDHTASHNVATSLSASNFSSTPAFSLSAQSGSDSSTPSIGAVEPPTNTVASGSPPIKTHSEKPMAKRTSSIFDRSHSLEKDKDKDHHKDKDKDHNKDKDKDHHKDRDHKAHSSPGRLAATLTSENLPKIERAIQQQVWVLVRSPTEDRTIRFPMESHYKGPKQVLKAIKEEYPEFSGISFRPARNPSIHQDLLALEQRLTPKGYKFGVLLATKNNKTENCFFNNNAPSPELDEFLGWLGDRVELKNWDKYDGGLDTSDSRGTGTHSIYTCFKNIQVMFHVSTMIPYEADDDQQVQRKRHLGNDVVIILFQESDVDWPFDPSVIRSYFNHVFFVVRKDVQESKFKGHPVYRFAGTYKRGVEAFGPHISKTSTIEQTEHGRQFLLTKLINSERAAYAAPGFAKAIERTRQVLLTALFNEHYTQHTSGWASGW